jgi:hypothetical protein
LSEDSRPAHLPGALQVEVAGKIAVAAFWDMLQDFVAVAMYPAAWLEHISAHHPFLCVRQNAHGSHVLCVQRHE